LTVNRQLSRNRTSDYVFLPSFLLSTISRFTRLWAARYDPNSPMLTRFTFIDVEYTGSMRYRQCSFHFAQH